MLSPKQCLDASFVLQTAYYFSFPNSYYRTRFRALVGGW